MNKKISVVVTSYNYAKYIRNTIESVINQSYPNWELIIVDDGSSDNSIEIINEYVAKDERIKLYYHANNQNKGLGESLKLGIKKSTSDWIAFLESDDIFMPDSLELKLKTILENPNIDILFTGLEMFESKEKIAHFEQYFESINKNFINLDSSGYVNHFRKILPKLNIIPTLSVVMLKKEILQNCDFSPLCKASLDYYLWAQLAYKNFYYLNKKLTYWRIHDDSYINTDKYSWFTQLVFFTKIYKLTIKEHNPIIRFLLTINYIRSRLIYIKINKEVFKINIANSKFIFEKKLR